MSNMMFSALDRTPGGKDRLINSMGLSDSVPAAKAGIASTQNNRAILVRCKVASPINSFHAGES